MKNIFLGLTVTLLMTACASSSSNKPLYYWDSAYDKSVYHRLNKDGDADKEIAQLEKMAQKAYDKQKKMPPGFYAHLGLLHHDAGNMQKMQENLQKEAELYEESRAYMEFLLKNKTKGVKK